MPALAAAALPLVNFETVGGLEDLAQAFLDASGTMSLKVHPRQVDMLENLLARPLAFVF